LIKIKDENPKGLVFVAAVPIELINGLKQFREMNINADFIEASQNLATTFARESLGELAEKAYTITLPFVLGKTGQKFSKTYEEVYQHSPFLAAPFGYELVNFVKRVTGGEKISGKEFIKRASKIRFLNTDSFGKVDISSDGEINPETISVQVINGKLVEVKQ